MIDSQDQTTNQSVNMKSSVIVILFATVLLVVSCSGSERAPIHVYRLCQFECWKQFTKCNKGCQGGNRDAGFKRCERKLKKCEAKCEKILNSLKKDIE
ncbi:hypothetical protein LSAT2_002468 [Lamellibrachia satsuma]|nr:hypothetical protein LSAT2_002468 [Lamellibrachia satsuma]